MVWFVIKLVVCERPANWIGYILSLKLYQDLPSIKARDKFLKRRKTGKTLVDKVNRRDKFTSGHISSLMWKVTSLNSSVMIEALLYR